MERRTRTKKVEEEKVEEKKMEKQQHISYGFMWTNTNKKLNGSLNSIFALKTETEIKKKKKNLNQEEEIFLSICF